MTGIDPALRRAALRTAGELVVMLMPRTPVAGCAAGFDRASRTLRFVEVELMAGVELRPTSSLTPGLVTAAAVRRWASIWGLTADVASSARLARALAESEAGR